MLSLATTLAHHYIVDMTPTKQQKNILQNQQQNRDDEGYHSKFDDILEEYLIELDPQWMKAMNRLYEKSGMNRWCA